ncbi:helix-turn-helix transcriptional regulator [Bordetella hinzii]|uniref:helix-turn-helix transcriptional regulator n=1 Tax=Bordetella hinzii TaxID=103855 RepID=UPI0013EFDF0F|nr:helix-turn-helix transcriptional regulator [Bordetella hinzii]QII84914.1 helix-turn-helix transcriptional regulator [Bordetella hinzii]
MVKAYTSAGDESRLLEAMYGAALGENDWTEVLTFLRQATGVALVALLSQDPRTDLPLLNAVATHDDAWAEQAMGSYQREFFLHDPTPAAVQGWQAGRWFNDRRAFSEHERAHSLYYQEFLRPQGLGSWSGTYLFNEPHSQAFISLQCLADDKRSEDPDLRLSDGLTAHLARALRVASRLGDVQRRAVVAESTLDQLETPVLLLEEETGRLLLANAAARRLMQAEPVLAFRGDRVAPGVLSDSATWRAACRAGGCVLRAASGAPMALSLIPVPPGSTLARSWLRPLVLMSLPSNKSAAARARRLRQLYGLTQAEAEVAVMLACEELTPAECADRRGVSVGTIRAQIKMLQMKMDVSRLAQIVSLALMV